MVKRRFLLGEEWLYFKIYCGVRTADVVLKELIALLTQNLLKKELIDSWFFIRYGDPDPHIRLRFKIRSKGDLSSIIADFNKLVLPYLDENLIWNIQTDSYVRELERYGESTIELCEELFFYNSELVLTLLNLVKDEEFYFFYVLKNIDMFVDLFGFGEKEKLEFYEENTRAYKNEFGIGKVTKLSLDKKYRASLANLNIALNQTLNSQHQEAVLAALKKNELQMAPLTKKIVKHHLEKTLQVSLNSLIGSCVHMFVNRAFRDQQRFFELLAYDFLARHQNSKINRLKHTPL